MEERCLLLQPFVHLCSLVFLCIFISATNLTLKNLTEVNDLFKLFLIWAFETETWIECL